jgi:hypothetical protein
MIDRDSDKTRLMIAKRSKKKEPLGFEPRTAR